MKFLQVYLVVGGYSVAQSGLISSTETLVSGYTAWTTVSSLELPLPTNCMASVSLDNKIFIMGKFYVYLHIKFLPEFKLWPTWGLWGLNAIVCPK